MAMDTLAEQIVIAGATRADAPAIHDLLRALARALDRPHDVRSTPDDIARYGFGASPSFETVIARRGTAAVGLALFFYEFSTWRGCPGVYVQDLYVDEMLRGTGLGRRLLAAVVAQAAGREARYLRLAVDAGNAAGLGFYGRLGFVAPQEQTLVLEGCDFAALVDG